MAVLVSDTTTEYLSLTAIPYQTKNEQEQLRAYDPIVQNLTTVKWQT